ncbi:MAG: hypothetical protein KDF63_17055, partial [Rhodoferax sp.]|nr:hypothetical protein [Rhodoferax sp.]
MNGREDVPAGVTVVAQPAAAGAAGAVLGAPSVAAALQTGQAGPPEPAGAGSDAGSPAGGPQGLPDELHTCAQGSPEASACAWCAVLATRSSHCATSASATSAPAQGRRRAGRVAGRRFMARQPSGC